MSSSARAIGLMDSGLGGLSVLKELRLLLPHVPRIYFADSAFCPYGTRSYDFIRNRSWLILEELVRHGAQVLVVACNTASAAALEWLRDRIDLPVVGMEPAIKPAARATRNGRVGVLATGVTLEARRFARLLEQYAEGIQVFSEPATELVPLIERGELDGPVISSILQEKLQPMIRQEIDTLVLGCTHYPFLVPVLSRMLGSSVAIIDTSASVAAQAVRVYRDRFRTDTAVPTSSADMLLTSGDPAAVRKAATTLLPEIIFEPLLADEKRCRPDAQSRLTGA